LGTDETPAPLTDTARTDAVPTIAGSSLVSITESP
jgi:hypothetical protein